MSKQLSRDEILQANDRPIEKVEVPEWGGHVFVQSMSGNDRDKMELRLTQMKGNDPSERFSNLRALVVSLCVVDNNGKHLFSEKDVDELGKKSATALDRVFQKSSAISRILEDSVKEAEKN